MTVRRPLGRSRFKVEGSREKQLPRTLNLEPGTNVRVGSITIGPGRPLVLIAGPDIIESERHLLSHAERIATMCERAGVSYIVKCSYDKANRTSGTSFRGPGMKEGLK
ncbi:MAG: hypothetical protein HYS71_05355, partial [Candidatus Omnitrophica bacterium]|nr:hypothetical protein [Candidatus Omnitrophota bacterium]